LTCAPGQIEKLEIRDLIRALTSLPEEQREAVPMISLSGDYYETPSACKVPVGTIRSRLSRGRKALRAMTGMAPAAAHRQPLRRHSLDGIGPRHPLELGG
jgi:RNA polymerase sigma-70 factor, ECF subfamily